MRNNSNGYMVSASRALAALSLFSAYAVLPPKINPKPVKLAKISQLEKNAFSRKDCRAFIKQMETERRIPEGLLMAIAMVESEHNPWAINCGGVSRSFASREAARKFLVDLRNKGKVNINIGVLQINYGAHKANFKTAEAILNPIVNITYAAKYLADLRKRFGSWQKAVRFYHSPAPKYQRIYLNKVMNVLKKNGSPAHNELARVSEVSLKRSGTNG